MIRGKLINILAAIDTNYLKPLIVMLKSLFTTNRDDRFHVYIMHSSLSEEDISCIRNLVEYKGHCMTLLKVEEELFQDAPIFSYYSKEIYFRLLAPYLLPKELDRILYLDSDIIINGSIADFYNMDLEGHYLATARESIAFLEWVHKKRLGLPKESGYFNSGVILFNLEFTRKNISLRQIFDCIESNNSKLFYPDQDVLNILFHKKVRFIDKQVYNYNSQFFWLDKLKSFGQKDMVWLQKSAAIIHFAGRNKPWDSHYRGAFKELYHQYDIL